MKKVKYLILGAGPAGLSFACRLKQRGEDSFLVLEKEEEAGGLCRSMSVDGAPLDIGGGHFLDVRRPEADEFLFGFMPGEEWDQYERDSRISFEGGYIGHPFEANIWQMPEEKQREYLASIAQAGCNRGEEMPSGFVDWIYWKLGRKIAEEYMLPYNEKMFGSDLNALGTYWLEKLPNVSYEETLESCRERRALGSQPGHARFFYPKKYGYGEVWLRMQKEIGENIVLNAAVKQMDVSAKRVVCTDGSVYEGEKIITTIPWNELETIGGIPEELEREVRKLRHSSVQIEYFPENMDTEAQWIYYPEREIPYHRILVRHNFCPGSKGFWTETNSDRVETGSGQAEINSGQAEINSGQAEAAAQRRPGRFRYENEYAYPLNTIDKPEIMKKLLAWSEQNGIYGLGRWGEHEHYNSDLVVERAMKLADRL